MNGEVKYFCSFRLTRNGATLVGPGARWLSGWTPSDGIHEVIWNGK